MKKTVCINCDLKDHTFKECLKPVISHGILGFKINDGEINFLLIQRKDTMGYIDFLRGKYSSDISKSKIYKTLLEEMTCSERRRIKTLPFDILWDDLWVNHFSRAYLNEKKTAKLKFNSLDTGLMADNTDGKWEDQEYCIPKGRKNQKETKKECSIREFKEETNFKDLDFRVKDSLGTLSETFYGSNGIMYTHSYLLAEIVSDTIPKLDPANILMMGEIKNIGWFNFKEAVNIFRDYDSTKRNIIYMARKKIMDSKIK